MNMKKRIILYAAAAVLLAFIAFPVCAGAEFAGGVQSGRSVICEFGKTTDIPAETEPERLQWQTVVSIVSAVISLCAAAYTFICNRPQGNKPEEKKRVFRSSGYTEPVRKNVSGNSDRGEYCLVFRGGYLDGRTYRLSQGDNAIGRDPSCVIRYPADCAGISRTHAVVTLNNNRLSITAYSSEGTFIERLNGKIPAEKTIALEAGDNVRLGDTNNTFTVVKK